MYIQAAYKIFHCVVILYILLESYPLQVLKSFCHNLRAGFVSMFNTNWFLVPGGNDGPSGVLVCSENYLTYKNFGDQQDIRCPIPRRKVGLYYCLCFYFL